MASAGPIVVGIDFTPCSRTGLAQALRIGAASGAPVHAVHVIDTLVVTDLEEALSRIQMGIREHLIADAKSAWRPFISGVAGAESVPLEVAIDNGAVGVLRFVGAHRASLLVLGAFGEKAAEVGVGTMATECVRKSPVDVLLVRDTHPGPFKRIVACVDFSPTSMLALERAAVAAARDGAELRIVHLFRPPWHQLRYRAPTTEAAPAFMDQYREVLERRLRAVVQDAGSRMAAANAICEVIDYPGHRSGIAQHAARVRADLVVLGTRGRSNLRDTLLGSTAEKVLRDSSCSILAVKPASPVSATR